MANLTTVGIASGVPNSGTGTVSTIDALMADGGQATIGAKADTAYSDGTGAAAGSEISLLKGAFVKLAALVTDAFSKGTAGSASTDVITIQGIASMTPVKTDGSAVTQPVSNSTLTNAGAGNYETIAASQTDQAMGATGATGDYFSHLTIIPGTTSPGAVSIKDGSGSSISVFAGGPSSVVSLAPFTVYLGAISGSGAWKVTTGANVTAIGFGKFT